MILLSVRAIKALMIAQCMILFLFSSLAVRADFKAAVTTVDITPESPKMLLGYNARQSVGIHDRIHHRVVVMDDGKIKFILVSTELGALSPSQYDQVSGKLKEKFGIEPRNFWWTVTHTHSAPEMGAPGLLEVFLKERFKHTIDSAYTRFVEETLIKAVGETIQRLEPAAISVGWGFAQANINRRAISPDGKASLGMNPYGAVDRRIGLIRLERPGGSTIALLANYPVHGTVFGPDNLDISGDVAGIISTYVEEKIGIPLLFINGAAGNLAPLYSGYKSVYGSKKSELDQMCVILGDKILAANSNLIKGTTEVNLYTGSLIIETPRKDNIRWPEYLSQYTRKTNSGIDLIRLPLLFLRINNDIAIWSSPAELFCEISNEIRDRSPFPYTFYYGYTNGWLGYLPTASAWKHGGYEVEVVCPYTPEAEMRVKEGVLGYLKGELRSKDQTSRW